MFGVITVSGIITSYLNNRSGALIPQALTQEFSPIILSFVKAVTFSRSPSAFHMLSDGISKTLQPEEKTRGEIRKLSKVTSVFSSRARSLRPRSGSWPAHQEDRLPCCCFPGRTLHWEGPQVPRARPHTSTTSRLSPPPGQFVLSAGLLFLCSYFQHTQL